MINSILLEINRLGTVNNTQIKICFTFEQPGMVEFALPELTFLSCSFGK